MDGKTKMMDLCGLTTQSIPALRVLVCFIRSPGGGLPSRARGGRDRPSGSYTSYPAKGRVGAEAPYRLRRYGSGGEGRLAP